MRLLDFGRRVNMILLWDLVAFLPCEVADEVDGRHGVDPQRIQCRAPEMAFL